MISADEKAELLKIMRAEVAAQMNIILNGTAADAETDTESIDAMFPGMNRIENRPSVKPYGFHSLAPDGTLSITARVGAHAGSRYVIGHRDSRRPELDEKGDATLYNAVSGYEIRVQGASITLRKGSQIYTAVVGEPLAQILSAMLGAIASHVHPVSLPVQGGGGGNVNGNSGAPDNAGDFSALQSEVDGGAILAQDGGGF